jgi:hypothetical protein
MAPIEYYAYMHQYDCTIELNDYYIKQTIRNRCTIYGANGKLNLTVPKIRKSSSKTALKDIKINYDHKWQKEHWQSLMSSYRSSPFFEYYEDEMKGVFHKKYTNLVDLNMEMLSFISTKIGISTDFKFTKTYSKYTEQNDLRNHKFNTTEFPRYIQVFENKHGFISNLSILDLLFNEGNNSKHYLESLKL